MTIPNPLTDRFEVDNPNQTKAQAFVDQMRQITTNPSFTVPTGNPVNNNSNAGKGTVTLGAIPPTAQPKKL